MVTVEIDKIVSGGLGLGREDSGRVLFVPFTAPGDIVEVELTSEKKKVAFGKINKIIKASDLRIEPKCKYFSECGGCHFQHLTYEKQLEIKIDCVKDHFKRNCSLEIETDIVKSTPWAYRNRVQLHKNGQKAGFKKLKGNEIVLIDECPIMVDNLNMRLKRGKWPKKDRFILFSNGDRVFTETKDPFANATIKNFNFQFNTEHFFQNNLSILEEFSDYVSNKINCDELWDLYTGVGFFSHFAKEKVKSIKGVELSKGARKHWLYNVDEKFKFYTEDVDRWLKSTNKGNASLNIILDPPRTGLNNSIIKSLLRIKAEKIIYVSCDTATMSRDIKSLIDGGYKMEEFKLFDLYPQTFHVEAVSVLRYNQ